MSNAPKVPVTHVRSVPAAAPVGAVTQMATLESSRALASIDFNEESLRVLKASARCKDLNDDEFAFYIQVCNRRQLDPFCDQIHAIVRNGPKTGRTLTIQTGIGGFRLIAARTGQYEGQLGPFWCGKDGVWKDVWLEETIPMAAKVGVHRKGFREAVWSVARYDAYCPPDGFLWQKMPEGQIAKCAEALALRRAFPEDLSGIYADEEMEQANAEVVVAGVVDRDTKPANVSMPTQHEGVQAPKPGPVVTVVHTGAPPAKNEMTEKEQAVVAKFGPLFAAAKTHEEIKALHMQASYEVGGRSKVSPAYLKWHSEALAQARAALVPAVSA